MRQWKRLWDHLVTASTQPQLLHFVVVAYLKYFKTTLMAIKAPPRTCRERSRERDTERDRETERVTPICRLDDSTPLELMLATAAPGGSTAAANVANASASSERVIAFLRHQNALDIGKLLQLTYSLRSSTPKELASPPQWPGNSSPFVQFCVWQGVD